MTVDFSALADKLNSQFLNLSVLQRLALAVTEIPGRVVFTTSFGLEDQMITHVLLTAQIDVEIVTLDTGRLFPETYKLWHETEQRYGKRIRAKYPQADAIESLVEDQGIDGFYFGFDMRKACCNIRKVEPLGRALKDASGWITGLRQDQSAARHGGAFVTYDSGYDLLKINPLYDFERDAIVRFTHDHDVPVNRLHDEGFLSIGCAPCTRAVKQGEPERAGRWWWESENGKECGLHVEGNVITSLRGKAEHTTTKTEYKS